MRHDYTFKFLIADDPPPYPTRVEDLDIPPNYDTKAAQAELDALTPEEREKYEEGIASVIGDKNLEDSLKLSAVAAAIACKNIDNMFDTLMSTLVSLDNKYGTNFASELRKVQKKYRRTVDGSRTLAVDIALYAERYDDVIIPICADKDLTVERRINKIKEFITDGKVFETLSEDTKTHFDDLKTEFGSLTEKFSDWSKHREDDDRERIKVLREEIEALQKVIDDLNKALRILYGTLAATLPFTAFAAAFTGPFAPLVMAGGCIVAGLQLGAIVGLAIARNIKQSEMDEKNTEVKRLQAEVATIQATRTELDKTVKQDVKIFSSCVHLLGSVWLAAQNDAHKVQFWLEKGAQDADLPKYMMLQIGKSAGVYKTMGAYLQGYANGVTNIPK